MREGRAGLALVALIFVAGPVLAAEQQRSLSSDYPVRSAPIFEARCTGPASGIGGACFPVKPEDERLELRIEDERWEQAGARYAFETRDGRTWESGAFCSETSLPFVPSLEEDAPAVRLRVTVLGPGAFALACGGAASFGTTGTVHATFVSSQPT